MWRNIRVTGLTDEARDLVGKVKFLIQDTDMDKFDWDLTPRDQGNFDFKMMTFLWFKDGITPQDRKRVQLDLQQALVRALIEVKEEYVRATLETAPYKKPWNKAQATFLRTMRENACLTKEEFHMRWVSTWGSGK